MKKIMNISSLSVIASAIALSLIFTGCGDTDPENEGNHKPDVNIVQNNKTINVGTKVDLTSTAFDIDGDTLTYEWKFVSKPAGSSATLTTTTTKKASFTADKAGEYIIQFVAKDVVDAVGKDTVTITAIEAGTISNTCINYTEISGTYSTDKTLDGCFKVVSNITVSNNALLTIKPGSTLMFTKGTDLEVATQGALKAVGTATAPILFTAEQKTVGYWEGINFYYSNNVKNELAHIVVEYGGNGSGWHGSIHADSSKSSPTRLKIRDSVIRHSFSHGFHFDEYTILDEFKRVTSTKNKLTAGSLSANALSAIDTASNFTGNLGGDYVTLNGGYVTTDSTWNKLSVPVLVKKDIDISYNSDTLLTINPGAQFVFEAGVDFEIGKKGALKAVGTAKEPILFTAEQKTVGYWEGINFYYSNNVKNELAHIVVEYGGNGSGWHGSIHADSSKSSPTRLKIRDSVIRHSFSHGFHFDEYTILDEFKRVTSTKNKLTAGSLSANALSAIDTASNFTGNLGGDYVTLNGGYVTTDSTWNKLSVPVLVKNDIDISYNSDTFLTINPGAQFVFEAGIDLEIGKKGALKAVGTAKEPIIFTAKQETKGYWEGINFYYSNNVKNELEYINVNYAGNGSSWNGAVHIDSSESSPSRVSIKNSTFSNSYKYGIWLDRYSITNSDIASSNTFSNNTSGSIGTN